jgi:cation diffusion facilitator CzcD-associated flavoprotein CzcO
MTDRSVTDIDVLIVGAGISGIGAAHHLQEQCPDKSFLVLEALDSFGGTWLVHKYPGVRSDSDLYTFGYRFKPWVGPPVATAEQIQKYLNEVIEESGIVDRIRYRHRITSAAWSSDEKRWTVHVVRSDTGEELVLRTGFLWMCQGYYKHAEGYTPAWPGMADYRGIVVHPQTWPDDLQYRGKRVLVIGSGATTATLVPAIAEDCEHVTVLQRSPTYFWSGRNSNELADTLRDLEVAEEWVHEIVRRKILKDQAAITQLSVEAPDLVKDELLRGVRDQLPEGFDMTHFTPRYRPWQQRLAFVPDGDLFAGIRAGKVSIVTDEIETFTATGVRTRSGVEIDADIVVTATGFHLSVMGDIPFSVDGRAVDFADTITYRGMMFTGVPNLAWVFGYFRASWTLRVDLIGDFVCRLLAHLDELGAAVVIPERRPEDADMPVLTWIDPDDFNPGYLMRGVDRMPRRGDKPEWQHTQDYWVEKDALPAVDLDDGCLRFE